MRLTGTPGERRAFDDGYCAGMKHERHRGQWNGKAITEVLGELPVKLTSAAFHAMEMNRRTVPLPIWLLELVDSARDAAALLVEAIRLRVKAEEAYAEHLQVSAALVEQAFAEGEKRGNASPAPKASAWDLYLAALDEWFTHCLECDADPCETCATVLNRARLARKVWQSSTHKTVSDQQRTATDEMITRWHDIADRIRVRMQEEGTSESAYRQCAHELAELNDKSQKDVGRMEDALIHAACPTCHRVDGLHKHAIGEPDFGGELRHIKADFWACSKCGWTGEVPDLE